MASVMKRQFEGKRFKFICWQCYSVGCPIYIPHICFSQSTKGRRLLCFANRYQVVFRPSFWCVDWQRTTLKVTMHIGST